MKTIQNKIGKETVIYAETFEAEAMEQVVKMANFEPYQNETIRIMPDAHAGKGCTVGTTMTITDKVTPNLVGVDIGCLDSETEFLTDNGWKKISNYQSGDTVLQYDKKNDTAFFGLPQNYIVKDCDFFYHFKNEKGLDQMLSEEHKVLVWKGYKGKGYNLTDFSAQDLYNLGDKLNKGYYGIKTSFNIIGNGIDIGDNEIKIDVMVSADGTLRKNGRIEMHFQKDRKIERCKKLLQDSQIKYNEYLGSDNTTYIDFIDKDGIYTKNLNKYWNANQHQLRIIAEECLLWDGHSGYRSYFTSTNKLNADIIQFAFAGTNIRAGISTIKNNKWNDNYIVTPTKNNIIAISNTVNKVLPTDGKKYCFTVSTGYFVARRNGKIFITGNCGMLTVKLKNKIISLETLDEVIKSKVPCGFNVHEKAQTEFDLSGLVCKNHVDTERAKISIGSLGGGNHFIEVSHSELTGDYYLIVHSGSRKLGGDVCKFYQDKAFKNAMNIGNEVNSLIAKLKSEGRENEIEAEVKKIKRSEIEKDLCYLQGSDFDNYMNDMEITQKFASKNRETIAGIIIREAGLTEVERFETIHNYIDFNRMILRKGAVSAEYGEKLLIPINMRDGSLLCVGKGNKNWNYSAPHGAGRLMSRSQAMKNLSMQEFEETMKGVYTTSVVASTLDEAPQAYKSIDEIMVMSPPSSVCALRSPE